MLIHQCVSANIFQKISKASTVEEAWDILSAGYGNSGKIKKVKIQSLRRQYELLAMGEQEIVVDCFSRLQILVNDMRNCDESMEDSRIVEKVLRTLTSRFEHIVVAVEESKDLESMTVSRGITKFPRSP